MLRKVAILLVVISAVVTSVFWVNRETWLTEFNQERQQQSKAFKAKGEAYGKEHDQKACLNEALVSFDGCTGFSCTVNHGVFLRACLDQAAVSDDFCNGVPEYREEPTEDDKSWAKFYCWDRNIRGDGCRLLMKQQQFFCSQ